MTFKKRWQISAAHRAFIASAQSKVAPHRLATDERSLSILTVVCIRDKECGKSQVALSSSSKNFLSQG